MPLRVSTDFDTNCDDGCFQNITRRYVSDNYMDYFTLFLQDVTSDIEIEFSPFTTAAEMPKQIYALFGDDLMRFVDLVELLGPDTEEQ